MEHCYRTSHTTLLLVLTITTLPVLAAPARTLVPVPKASRALPGEVRLTSVTYAFSGSACAQSDYALQVLGRSLGLAPEPQGAVRLQLAVSSADLGRAAQALSLPAPPAGRWREAFVLDCGVTDRSCVRLVGGPSGLIYGASALAQLATTEGGLALPRIALSDWPSFLTRAWTGVPRNPKDPGFAAQLDWLARWRINACYYEIYGDEGQDSAPPKIADIHRECARRGIELYGQISNWRTERLLKRELCASNPDDLAKIRRYSEELLDRGCDGLIFLFDDLTQQAVEHAMTCPLCKQRFGSLAAAQLELMRPMLEVARKRGVDRLIVCPTAYYSGWQNTYGGKLDGKQYFATWAKAEQMKGVQVYHCLLRRKDLEEVRQAGLTNFVYWCNGIYNVESFTPSEQHIEGVWSGLSELAFTWYAQRWDPQRGLVPQADAYAAFREMPHLTQHAWLCGSGEYPFALWGVYCWSAEQFDPVQAERDILTTMYGAPAQPEYAKWRDIIRKWYPRLLFPPSIAPGGKRDAYLGEMRADAVAASQAAAGFRAATKLAATAVPPADDIAPRMVSSAETLARMVETATSAKSVVHIGPVTEQRLAQGVQRECRLEIGDFWSRYALRYSQTEEPNGDRHRSQWHFGSGLGMTGPSYRNWYDAGFVDVLVDGKSLDAFAPGFTVVPGAVGDELQAVWKTDSGDVTLRFSVWQGGLKIAGTFQPRAAGVTPRLAIRLFAIPGAGSGDWKDMDKFAVTASGEFRHGTPVVLKPGETWLFLADRTYDIPHENAEGPCAVVFGEGAATAKCDNGSYVVQTDVAYPAGTRDFHLVVFDFHGQRNAEALAAFRALAAEGL